MKEIDFKLYLPRTCFIRGKGSTIIELLVATSIVGLVLTALIIALTYNIRTNAEVAYRETATSLNQQALEVFKKERARFSWEDYWSNLGDSGVYCINEPFSEVGPGFAGSTGGCGDSTFVVDKVMYQREAAISKDAQNGNAVSLEITTSWNIGSSTKSSVSTSYAMKERAN